MGSSVPISTVVCQGDHAIWQAFQNGNHEAFATLYHRYADVLVQNGLRIANERTMVEDCIHEFFIAIWKNKMNLSRPQSVRAYLLSSVRRMVVREMKKRRDQEHKIRNLPFDRVTYSVEDEIISQQNQRDRWRKVRKSIRGLSKRQQQAVYLKFYANLSYPQIAGKMSISTDSVYNLVSKAILTIEDELTKVSRTAYHLNIKNTA